ncbi:MAG: hypothetical protein U0R44_01055 [Candidatus Micrarchaeia archaeon]
MPPASSKLAKLKEAAAKKKGPAEKSQAPAKAEAPKPEAKRAEPERKKPAEEKKSPAPKEPEKPVPTLQPKPSPPKSEPPPARRAPLPKTNKQDELAKKLYNTVMEDVRLTDFAMVSRILVAARRRLPEVESKTKSIRDIVNEEVKKMIDAQSG